ncbi:MAG: AEC family transporter [Acetobacteraceae bacterium]|nr:AEC family transporter [Pseudomonadota bacterium]
MANIILLFGCLLLGVVFGMTKRFPENAHLALNAFILHISLPAMIFLYIHNIHLHSELILSVAMPWLLFAFGCGFFYLIGRFLGFSRPTTGGLMLVGGLANTSFVGLPMIEAFYGKADLATGILIDQLGTYLVLSTLGILVAASFSSGNTRPGAVVLRIVTFPPLIALVIALALMKVTYPAWAQHLLLSLAATLGPLALVSVGLQLRLEAFRGNVAAMVAGLGYKLVLGPAIVALIYVGWLHRHGPIMQVTLFEAAMGPQIGGAIVGIQYGLNPALITLVVAVGIVLSFLTLPVWYYLLIPV